MSAKIIAIVDADPIVYRAGFAGERRELHVVWSPRDSDEIFQEQFYPDGSQTASKKFKAWRLEQALKVEPDFKPSKELTEARFIEEFGPVILNEEPYIVPEPVENVLATVRSILRDHRYAVAEHFNTEVHNVHLRTLLSGPGNFRNEIATVAPYKGNRKLDHKPYWYQQIRNYLTGEADAEVIEGREADDECSILQLQYAKQGVTSIVCSIDKDLDMVPGHHYNYWRKAFYYTKPDEGQALFYKQVLSGDPTDNIPGAHKIGAKRADDIVDAYLLDNPADYAGLWERIITVYDDTLSQYGEACKYYDKAHDEGVEAVVIEMARLVKMQEYEGQLWNPPYMEDDKLEPRDDFE